MKEALNLLTSLLLSQPGWFACRQPPNECLWEPHWHFASVCVCVSERLDRLDSFISAITLKAEVCQRPLRGSLWFFVWGEISVPSWFCACVCLCIYQWVILLCIIKVVIWLGRCAQKQYLFAEEDFWTLWLTIQLFTDISNLQTQGLNSNICEHSEFSSLVLYNKL